MNWSREKLWAVIGGAALVAALTVFFLFYMPLIKKLGAAGAGCRAVEAQLASAQGSLEALKKETRLKSMLGVEAASLAMDELTRAGKSRRVNFISLVPKPAESSNDPAYKILPIEVETSSDYEGLGAFLGSLDDLEKSLVAVKEFEVSPESAEPEKVKTKMVLAMYLGA